MTTDDQIETWRAMYLESEIAKVAAEAERDSLRIELERAQSACVICERVGKERDGWIEEARRYAGNADYWRDEQRRAEAATAVAIAAWLEHWCGNFGDTSERALLSAVDEIRAGTWRNATGGKETHL